LKHKPKGAECQCANCDVIFTSVSAFDLHFVKGSDGRSVCQAPEDVTNRKGDRLLFGKQRSQGKVVWGGVAQGTDLWGPTSLPERFPFSG
jgi:hypothetical protein